MSSGELLLCLWFACLLLCHCHRFLWTAHSEDPPSCNFSGSDDSRPVKLLHSCEHATCAVRQCHLNWAILSSHHLSCRNPRPRPSLAQLRRSEVAVALVASQAWLPASLQVGALNFARHQQGSLGYTLHYTLDRSSIQKDVWDLGRMLRLCRLRRQHSAGRGASGGG